MTVSRTLLIVAGVLIAVFASILLARGLLGLNQEVAPVEAAKDAGKSDESPDKKLPRWEDFAHADDSAVAVPRPVLEGETTSAAQANSASPFDGAYDRVRLESLALRLEGVAPGAKPMALISGRVVRTADRIDVFRISKISSSGVVLVGPSGARFDLVPGTNPSSDLESNDSPERRTSSDRPSPEGGIWPASRRGSRGSSRQQRETAPDRLLPLRDLAGQTSPFTRSQKPGGQR